MNSQEARFAPDSARAGRFCHAARICNPRAKPLAPVSLNVMQHMEPLDDQTDHSRQ